MPLEPPFLTGTTDLDALRAAAREADRTLHAAVARASGGIMPASMVGAFIDWTIHLALSPGKQHALHRDALHAAGELA